MICIWVICILWKTRGTGGEPMDDKSPVMDNRLANHNNSPCKWGGLLCKWAGEKSINNDAGFKCKFPYEINSGKKVNRESINQSFKSIIINSGANLHICQKGRRVTQIISLSSVAWISFSYANEGVHFLFHCLPHRLPHRLIPPPPPSAPEFGTVEISSFSFQFYASVRKEDKKKEKINK